MSNTETTQIDFIPICDLKGKHFIVKDYQRGYKWDPEQIKALLKDITEHKSGKYCLQPVIIDQEENGIELIDGQQRITSIYLILHYLGQSTFYSLDYQTRERTRIFLNEQLENLHDAIAIGMDWKTFVSSETTKSFDNVDIYHLFEVYSAINIWFKDSTDLDKSAFLDKLTNDVYVIWYDIKGKNTHSTAEDVFLNLNAGKIPLTNSELIKALFILTIQRQHVGEVATLKTAEFATEWDTIENKLHEDGFWFFICDHNYYQNLDTRIDFIIDLANGLTAGKNKWYEMASYHKFEKLYFNDKPLNWSQVKNVYNKLLEWYNDKEHYHLIGFLIMTRIASLSDILVLSKDKNKSEFKSELIKKISSELKKTKEVEGKKISPYDIDTLHYEDFKRECKNVLLLLNIQYYLNNSSDNRFPFNLYIQDTWSVEHINPQNPREFDSVNSLMNWLRSFLTYFGKQDAQENTDILVSIESVLKTFEAVSDKSRKPSELKLSKDIMDPFYSLVELLTDKLDLHGIGNLALIDKHSNSALSNKTYLKKRNEILGKFYSTNNGIFIPDCTKDVFTKSYSNEKANVLDEIFGIKDMEDYKTFISQQLKNYSLPGHD